jgi:hypothetical protein
MMVMMRGAGVGDPADRAIVAHKISLKQKFESRSVDNYNVYSYYRVKGEGNFF